LFSFDGIDGSDPNAGLIADADGNLFGTTLNGGAYGYGNVFEIVKTASGYASSPTILASFDGTPNGGQPLGSLILDAEGNLVGTTVGGGVSGDGIVFEIAKTASGYSGLTILASFDYYTNGSGPIGSLLADANGHLFGVTQYGGVYSDGTVFEITPAPVPFMSD